MNPQDPLANLHPLRQPELIGWWPPAPGWWLLLSLILIALAAVIYLVRRHYRRNAYRRRALQQLQTLQTRHQADGDDGEYLASINALLKSVAVMAYPRATVAAQHGEAWRQFLNLSLPPDTQLESDFDTALYRRERPDIDVTRVHRAAQIWIRKHRAAP